MARKKSSIMTKIGPWAFILGLLVAFVASIRGQVAWILGVLGLVVGLLNISDAEVRTFLIASMTFLISANVLSVTLTNVASMIPFIGERMNFINPLLANFALFVAPAAGIVALKALYMITRD